MATRYKIKVKARKIKVERCRAFITDHMLLKGTIEMKDGSLVHGVLRRDHHRVTFWGDDGKERKNIFFFHKDTDEAPEHYRPSDEEEGV